MKHLNQLFILNLAAIVVIFSGCSGQNSTEVGASLDISKSEKTFCVMAGCTTSQLVEGEKAVLDYSTHLTLEGTIADAAVTKILYTIAFDCGELAGDIPVTSGAFQFNYPVSGGYYPTGCESAVSQGGNSIEGRITLKPENSSSSYSVDIIFRPMTAD